MKRDHRPRQLGILALLAFVLAACTTNPDGTQSANKTAVGAVAGAVVGYGVGVALSGKDDKKRKKNGRMGAVAGAALGAAAGATIGYIDREIAQNKIFLSNKMDAEIVRIEAKLDILEENSNVNRQLIGRNYSDLRQLQNRYEIHDREILSLNRHLADSARRVNSTSAAIKKINVELSQSNYTKRRASADDQRAKAILERQRAELANQSRQLAKQHRIIQGLLAAINQHNQNVS